MAGTMTILAAWRAPGPSVEASIMPMPDWTDMPEAAGPQSEGILYGKHYGDPGMPSIRPVDPPLTPEQRDRERADAERRGAIRATVEQAAMAAAASALEARALADRVLADADAAADKAVQAS